MTTPDAGSEAGRSPHLTVVSGSPTPEEIAIVVSVLARRSSAPGPADRQFSLWARKSRMTRPAQRPGFGAWRASAMPR